MWEGGDNIYHLSLTSMKQLIHMKKNQISLIMYDS